MIDWNIQSRAHACQVSARPFATGETYHTLLVYERGEYQRLDVCDEVWRAQFAHGATDRKGFISHWQGVYEAPPALPPDAIQKDTAESLLRKLVEKNDPQHRAVSYILAVMLERKRLLKVKAQTNEGGQRVFIYEQPKTGDIFTIPDPNLQLNQLDEVQRQVAHLLEQGLGVPPVEPFVATDSIPPVAALGGVSTGAAPAL